jgi:hypothetical protein
MLKVSNSRFYIKKKQFRKWKQFLITIVALEIIKNGLFWFFVIIIFQEHCSSIGTIRNTFTVNNIFSGNQPYHCWAKNQRFKDLSLHHHSRFGEWRYVADICASVSNRCMFLLVYFPVRGRSQTVGVILIRLLIFHVLLNLMFCCHLISLSLSFAWSSLRLLAIPMAYVRWIIPL